MTWRLGVNTAGWLAALAGLLLAAAPTQGRIVIFIDDDAPPGGNAMSWREQMPGRIPRPRVLKVGKAFRKTTHGVISTLKTQHPACRIQIRVTRKSLVPGQPGAESSNAIPLPCRASTS